MFKGRQNGRLLLTVCFILWVFLVTVLLPGCGKTAGNSDALVEMTLDDKVNLALSKMSRTEKVGQLVMIGIQGYEADNDSLYMLHQYHIGGIILFDRNLQTVEQVKKLTADLQAKSEEKAPLFIAIDEEGGTVCRGKEMITPPPSQLELGEEGKPEAAGQWAEATGKELKALGINVNFAPVADLGSLNTRHFSEEAEEAAAFVQAAGQGYEKAGIIYALKHFPGIGSGEADTHFGAVSVDASREELEEDLLPFRKMIDSGKTESFMIMVSHAEYPELEEDTPASLSPVIMTDILRRELGYQGVIVTDDMEMEAAAQTADFRQLGVMALKAGADIVLVCHEYEHETELYLGILEALEKGELTEKRIDESVRRILRLKLANC